MDCRHEFIGTDSGVTCAVCGLHMSHDEYVEYLRSGKEPASEKKAPAARRAKKKEADK